jgi:hypothetical protein
VYAFILKDVREFVEGARDGVILFSLGTIIATEQMPLSVHQMLFGVMEFYYTHTYLEKT